MAALLSKLRFSYPVDPFRFLKTDKLFSVLAPHPVVAAVLPPSTLFEKVAFGNIFFSSANFSTGKQQEIKVDTGLQNINLLVF